MSSNSKLQDYPNVDFKGSCGEAGGHTPNFAASTGMDVFQQATVNGGPVNNCVKGNDDACVYNFWLTQATGIYKYQVTVDAQGPSGIFSGYLHLAFTDESGDTYFLKIYSSSRKQHTVSYNSNAPKIMRIWWCDYDFNIPTTNNAKPDYMVVSPAHTEEETV